MRTFGLIGYHLDHSFSKKYFTEKFEREQIKDCVYENYELDKLDGLRLRMLSIPSLEGLNVTIPYKEKITELLDDSDEIVIDIKACNCIKITGGKWIGYNTDVVAFEQSFKPNLKPNHTKALILGTGGASKAVTYVLRKLGIEILFVSCSKSGVGYIDYSAINNEIIRSYPVIINCTPVGTFPDVANSPKIPYGLLTSSHYLYDLTYNPQKTLFLSQGEGQGTQIKNGFQMLELQAEESWRIWNM